MIIKDNVLNLDFDLVETNCYKTLPHYNFWGGWWKQEPRNIIEIVANIVYTTFRKVFNCFLIIFNMLLICAYTALNILMDRY